MDAWKSGGLGVAGPEATLSAFQLGQVDELIITAIAGNAEVGPEAARGCGAGRRAGGDLESERIDRREPAETVRRIGHARAADRGAHQIHRRRFTVGRCRWRGRIAKVPHMSRQNKVNPGMYTQRGRLTQDDAARELRKQREVGSQHTWQPVKKDQLPRFESKQGAMPATGTETSEDTAGSRRGNGDNAKAAPRRRPRRSQDDRAAKSKTAKQDQPARRRAAKTAQDREAARRSERPTQDRAARNGGGLDSPGQPRAESRGGGGPKPRKAAKRRKS